MNGLTVALGTRSYPIYIDSGLFASSSPLSDHIRNKRICIVSNDVVAPLYLDKVAKCFEAYELDTIILPDGEAEKTLANFEKILAHLLANGHGRDTTIVALGGGVIGDITGFAAACYQRGVDFIQAPTTLLSQVDSSVGGKTAVNHALGKNMIGAFYQPKAVVIDIDCLATLPAREFSAGMAEVIKYGILGDAALFDWIESNQQAIAQKQPALLAEMIKRCCQNKADIVAADEKEAGQRALLNLGHTFGHAIEAEMGYGVWLHGEAVATGMVLAAKLSRQLNLLELSELRRIEKLLLAFDLPIEAPKEMSHEDFFVHMRRDKKNLNNQIRLIVPESIGNATIRDDISEEQLKQIL